MLPAGTQQPAYSKECWFGLILAIARPRQARPEGGPAAARRALLPVPAEGSSEGGVTHRNVARGTGAEAEVGMRAARNEIRVARNGSVLRAVRPKPMRSMGARGGAQCSTVEAGRRTVVEAAEKPR